MTSARMNEIIGWIRSAKDHDLTEAERNSAISKIVVDGVPELVRRVEELEARLADVAIATRETKASLRATCESVIDELEDLIVDD